MAKAKTAMVLAAGLGERMRPLTLRMPKPLVPLAGRPLIDHVLDRLAGAGVDTAVVNVHYLPDLLEESLARRNGTKPEILVSDERGVLLDTGGGAKRALPMLGAGPFFIHNADTVWSEGDFKLRTLARPTFDIFSQSSPSKQQPIRFPAHTRFGN